MTPALDSHTGAEAVPSFKGLVVSTYAALALLIVGLGGMAASISLAGAVVVPGRFVVASYPKPVQHLKGGIVEQILVEDGDRVSAGQLLLRMDETQTKSNLDIVRKRLNELNIRSARLLAEESGFSIVRFSEETRDVAANDHEVATLMEGERRLFHARQLTQERRKAQLAERVLQYQKQIEGLEAQIAGKREEIALARKEMEGVKALVEKKLLNVSRLSALQRLQAQLQGQLGGMISAVAETEGQIAETELRKLQVDDDVKSQASADLREVQAQIAEFEERRISAEDELSLVEIRAPQNGVVQNLSVHAAKAVVAPGNPILTIIPIEDNLIAEVRIAPQDIDQIVVGQNAVMRLSAFNQRTTPEISGHIVHISADLTQDQQTGEGFYRVRVTPNPDELAKLDKIKLLPGMPAEVFIQTEARSILSYLIKPASDQMRRAFREE